TVHQTKNCKFAIGLIVLMVIASVLSMLMAGKGGPLLHRVISEKIPALRGFAGTDKRSLEPAPPLRRMVISEKQTPPDQVGYAASSKIFRREGPASGAGG